MASRRDVEGRALGRQILVILGEKRAALRESQCKEEKLNETKEKKAYRQ